MIQMDQDTGVIEREAFVPARLHLQTRSIFIEFRRNVAFLLSPRRQLAISRESPRPQVSGIGEEKSATLAHA
jgi:hypothetical protein